MKRPSWIVAAAALAAAVVTGCQNDRHDALTVFVTLPEQDLANVAKATVLVDYSGAEAKIVSDGGSPACAFVLPGVDGDFTDDRKGTLTIHTSGRRALRGPADFVACQMEASSRDASPSDIQTRLSVRVAGAEDATGKAIDTTAKPVRSHATAPEKSESAIEAAQAQAAQTAAAISAAAPPPAPAPGTPTAGTGTTTGGLSAGAGAKMAGGAAGGSPGRQPPVPPTASGSRAATGGATANNVPAVAGNVVVDNGPAPNNQDTDPGYDDSPSEDPSVPEYTLEFAVTSSSGRIGALQLEVTHLGSSGGFIGRGDTIDCVALVEGLVAANYLGERTAKMGIVNIQGILSPAPIMRCGFRTRESANAPSFQIQVVDASSPGGDPIDPPPSVVLTVSRR